MPSRKGWLTPNAPIPSGTVCRRVLIPDDLQIIAAVNGALLELTKNYNWEQFGSASPEEIAAAMFSMYEGYVSDPCEGGSGCRRIYRIGQSGQIERSDDAGETWESAAAEIPPTPPRSEPTEAERLCSAAANVVNVLHLTYEEMIDAWQLDSSVDFGIGAFATILGLLVGSWLGIVSAVAIPFVWELFGGVYATIGTFLQDAWDSDFTDALTCLFLEAATDTGGVVTFDWSAISQGLADRVTETAAPEDALLWAQLNYMMLFIGVEGLNAAGATTGVIGDCGDCDGWCYTWDFSQTGGNWQATLPNNTYSGAAGTYQPGFGWLAVFASSSAGGQDNTLVLQHPVGATVTRIRAVYDRALGQYSPANEAYRIARDGEFFDPGITLANGASPGATGTDLEIEWNGDQYMEGVTIFLRSSFRSGAKPSPLGNVLLKRVTIWGDGDNPFGNDNC